MNENTLNIFWDEEYSVGSIFRNTSGKIVFQYNPDWLRNKKKPISISLPCQEKAFSPAISKAFFENLLPESDVRAELAFNHRFDKKDTFSFLSHFGKDCAGALSILPENEVPDFTFGKYSRINEKLSQLLELIKHAPEKHRLFSGMSHARLSIAGAQDKLPVYIEGKDFYLPQNTGSPTSHIIKPANYFFKDIQRNETFCMSLAKEIGINVPKVDLVNFDGHELFIIERYDRERLEAVVKRIHQEDFCQALGILPQKKYQEQGGPNFYDCQNLIAEHCSTGLIQTKTALTEVMCFNLLIGNNDAHAKNFSLLHNAGIRLAPFYDLVSSQVYPSLTRRFAMSIGDTYNNDNLKAGAFIKFANDMKLRREIIVEILNSTIDKVANTFTKVLDRQEDLYGKNVIYSNLADVIEKNIKFCQKLVHL